MFLNYKRSVAKYIILWIFTLGLYNYVFKKEVVRDLNVANGERVMNAPGAKYFFLNLFSLGIYGIFWDMAFLAKCEEYLSENGSDLKVDYESYRFLGIIPFVRIAVISAFLKPLNEVCRIYSEKQLDDISGEDDYMSVNRVRDVNESDVYVPTNPEKPTPVIDFVPKEEKFSDDIHKIAGYAVVEEYDPEKDQKRIAYRLQMERAARAAEREAAKNPAPAKPEPVKVEEARPEKYSRGRLWFYKVAVLMLLVFLLPLAGIGAVIFALDPVYEDSFVGELSEKFETLEKAKGNKIVVIGGSSVAFGLDSYLIEQAFDEEYEVVNFGLYADLGTKVMMDLSKDSIKKGDIIILAPEMNAQTLSLYFNGVTTLQAIDGHPEMLLHISPDDYGSLIGASLKFSADKLSYILSGTTPDTGREAYKKEHFNDYGDNMYDRPYNEMTPGVYANVINLDFYAKMSDTKVTAYEEYIEYVNKYVRYANRKGATVYFSFCPMSEAAMSKDNTEKSIDEFYNNLRGVLECEVISNVYDYILDEGYFFDSEFHLNNSGVTVRTVKLIDDIKRAQGNATQTEILDRNGDTLKELPAPPGFKGFEGSEELDTDALNAMDFVLELVEISGETYYNVVGISDVGKTKTELTIPNVYNGYPVRVISADAFSGSTALVKLYLGQNIDSIAAKAFNGSSIKEIYLHDKGLGVDITIPNNLSGVLATEGAQPDLKIFVPKGKFDDFTSDYFWGDYLSYLYEKQS